jgi:hypothetical protein
VWVAAENGADQGQVRYYGQCPKCGRGVTNRHHVFVEDGERWHMRCRVRLEVERYHDQLKARGIEPPPIPRSLDPPGPGEP